ncbi:MAG: BTAD domain-containing putative transcriptional regulator [Actinomycetota bacterium]
MAGAEMRVGLLGALEASIGDEPIAIGRLKVRQALAVLAAQPGSTLPTSVLIEQLWPDRLPKEPKRSLQVVVSRLRTALGRASDRLVTSADSYRLDADEVDVSTFSDLVAGARDDEDLHRAIGQLETALALWRGTPFGDALGPPLLDTLTLRLDETRQSAETLLVESLVRAGALQRAAEIGAPLVAEEPQRERLGIAVATALAGQGRRADALHVLGRVRSALRTDLGIDPTSALSEAELQILDGAIDLAPADPQPPVEDTVFVGRHAERALLATAESSAVITGESGSGKSALLRRVVADVVLRGERALVARAPRDPAEPLQLLADLVRGVGASADAGDDVGAAALARVAPQLAQPVASQELALSRESFVEAIAALIDRAAHGATIAIDDCQWIDGPSREVLVRLEALGRVRLILASVERLPWLADFEGPFGHLSLDGLLHSDVEAYVERRAPRSIARAEELHELSGGNPLFLRLLVDLLVEGSLGATLPTSVLVVVRQRTEQLSEAARGTLCHLAALGDSGSLADLVAVRPHAARDLREATETGLVSVDAHGNSVRFRHRLVRDAIYQMTSTGQRLQIHDALAEFTLRHKAQPLIASQHALLAAPIDPPRAVACAKDAGALCRSEYDYERGRRFYLSALEVADHYGGISSTSRAEALLGLGSVEREAGRHDHREHLQSAASLARSDGAWDLYAEVATEMCRHGSSTTAGSVDAETRDVLDFALARPLAPGVRTRLCSAAAALYSLSNQEGVGRKLFIEAFELAEAAGDPDLLAEVLLGAHLGLSHPDDHAHRHRAQRMLAAVAGSDPGRLWEAAFLRSELGIVDGDIEAIESGHREMARLAPRVGRSDGSFGSGYRSAVRLLLEGRVDAAEERLMQALEGGARFTESWKLAIAAGILLSIRDCQGRLAEISDQVDGLIESMPEFVNWRAVRALVWAKRGLLDEAGAELDRLAIDGFAGLTPDLTWTAATACAARAAVGSGHDEAATALYTLLMPHAGHMTYTGTCTLGPVDAVLGRIAAQLGGGSEDHFVAADRLATRLRAPVYRGQFQDGSF